MAVSTAIESVSDVESFIEEYYDAWSGTDLDRIMSYYAEDVVLQIPGLLMEGKEAVRDQFARPFITAFPGNRHLVKNMIFGPGVVTVEFIFEATHQGPFAGHAATGAQISLPGCGVYEYDSAKRQITAGRIYFDVATLLQTITDLLENDRQKAAEALQFNKHNLSLITDLIPTFIHVLRTDGSVLYVNQAVLGYHGCTLEDVRREDYRARFFHPEDVKRLRKERRDALRRPVPFENEQRVIGKDGKYRWFLIRYNPLLDEQGGIDRWYVAAFDIEDRKQAEDAQIRQAGVRADVSAAFSKPAHLGEILRGCTEAIVRHLDAAFARIWTLSKDESTLELQASAGMYTRLDGSYSRIPVGDLKVGLIAREKKEHFTNDVVNDPRVKDKGWAQDTGMVAFAGYPLVVEDRLIGVVALFARRTLSESILDTLASVADTIAQGIERKRAEEALRSSERSMSLIVNTIPTFAWSARPDGYADFLNQRWLNYTGMTAEEASGWGWEEAIHPDDRQELVDYWRSCVASGTPGETEARMRRFDGAYRWFLFRFNPLRDESGKIIKWYGTNIDIEDRKRGEEALRARELSWRQIVDSIPGFVATTGAMGEIEFLNRQTLEYFGRTQEELKDWALMNAVHPDDLPRVIQERKKSIETGQVYDIEHRCRRADGVYRWFQVRGLPVRDTENKVTAWYLLLTDIDDRKRVEEALQSSERNFRQVIDTIPTLIHVLRPDGSVLYVNPGVLDYTGLTLEDVQREDYRARVDHPEDAAEAAESLRERRAQALSSAVPFESEYRVLGKDGQYRWFLSRHNPLLDDQGKIDRWYVAATDIDDLKRAEAELRALRDRLYEENLVLRDEVDRTSMFEEIVGTSAALQFVLAQVAKVAPTDSTILITGETGTGKELIARAIHKQSQRSELAFIGVNCAAIPRELIASELFGHEKGAFTGATQRRLGRFELACGGTIFLDEVGELPSETQIALLRVLQEREFERVGGTRRIRANVRVIAATNRDLQATIRAGSFRSDLFYRLNVFPIAIPPLRERSEDIPLLVEYFIDRYARKAGKNITAVNKKTFESLQSYGWPGNIRELQNVIERSIILCETEVFSVDKNWLPRQAFLTETKSQTGLSRTLLAQEREMIEAALQECRGQVFGPSGAAARLGLKRSTLESKIRALKIDKKRFKDSSSS
ncbi:MAG: PAS domain-containing protein [Acidobacteria bacterium]|nr:PAS domain-containing protein [Acidobacteriota bacterium]